MEPVKLRLIRKTDYVATVSEEGLNAVDERGGHIEIICSGPQAFAEIVQRLLESHLAVAAVQQAIHCLQMAKSPADRVADLRMLQDVHHKITGYHFDSAAKPAAIEGVEPSSGSVSMEKAREMFGELDPAKIEKMFPGMPGGKPKILPHDRNQGKDKSIKFAGPVSFDYAKGLGYTGPRSLSLSTKTGEVTPLDEKGKVFEEGVQDFHPEALKE